MTAQLTHQQDSVQDRRPARPVGPVGPVSPAGRGLRAVCRRIRMAVREMNYASRRLVELQAPWIVDSQWHSK
jgi:hypothetical protein